jgi:murein DD-endopeptidase MepM/ murein hydrolase activator NlpD
MVKFLIVASRFLLVCSVLLALPAIAAPSVTLDPTSGPVNTQVTATGSGFTAGNKVVDVIWDNTYLTETRTDNLGNFSVSFNVLQDAAVGDHQVFFNGGSFGQASAIFTVTTATTGTSPEIVRVETFPEGVLVYFRLFYTDPDNDAEGFGFRGANGSGWAEETHPFSSPSYGRWSPGIIEYPFNHLCGQPGQYESDVEAWIYDSAGLRSQSVTIHLACETSTIRCSGAPFIFPVPSVDSSGINSYIGWLYKEPCTDPSKLHSGLDFWASLRAPVIAQAPGKVYAKEYSGPWSLTIYYPDIMYIDNDGH